MGKFNEVFQVYNDIGKLNLPTVLRDMREKLKLLGTEDGVLSFKLEFIMEELLTNSFFHTVHCDVPINIYYCVRLDKFSIDYQESGAENLDFAKLLANGRLLANNPSLDKVGGLGLHLISELAKQFDYEYNTLTKTRMFKMILS